MTWEDYKNNVKATDPVAKQDIEEAEVGAQQDKHDLDRFDAIMAESRNYATEVGMTEDNIVDAIRTVRQRKRGTRLKLESIAEENHLTMDEFFTAVLENAIQEGKEHPLDFKRFVEHNGANSNEKPEIELVRYYPVHYGETEYEAAKRAEESTS